MISQSKINKNSHANVHARKKKKIWNSNARATKEEREPTGE